jgi:hypothetical protein
MIFKNGIFFLMIAFAANSLFAVNLFSANSGFETAITPWKLSFHDTTKSNAKPLARDSVNALFGKKYLKVEVTKVDSAKTNWWIQLWEPTWTAKANVTYTFSCQAKSGDSLLTPEFDISATGDDDSTEYTYLGGKTQIRPTSTWQLYTYSYTWAKAAKVKHFRLFLGASKGIICFDSMYLDSATIPVPIKNSLSISYNNPLSGYTYQLLPNGIRFDMKNASSIASNVAIYSVGGRLLSSQNIPAAVSTFEIPKPASGAWIMDVNSNKKVIRVP